MGQSEPARKFFWLTKDHNSHLCLLVLVALSVFINVVGCRKLDIRESWEKLRGDCGGRELGKDAIFFGTTNTKGPGSIWLIENDSRPYSMSKLEDGFVSQESKTFISEDSIECNVQDSNSWKIASDIGYQNALISLGSELKNDLRENKKMDAQINKLAFTEISWTPFEKSILKKIILKRKEANGYIHDLLNPKYRILVRAYKLSGVRLNLHFDDRKAAEISGKYPWLSSGGSVKGGLEVALDSSNTVRISSPKEFYIEGDLKPVNHFLKDRLEMYINQILTDPNRKNF